MVILGYFLVDFVTSYPEINGILAIFLSNFNYLFHIYLNLCHVNCNCSLLFLRELLSINLNVMMDYNKFRVLEKHLKWLMSGPQLYYLIAI